ncbi:uncharacterized protein LOC107267650 [Cephus cinctus]|uniref:Uncharacterized protein LOC107267650 n=1 Tax=Cephus cinctus TaxID=211228 RepID=A0AAJ7BV80_CEPCN|nr:uncharacterized protein LOC107267650 [Cephus cinctus]
MAQFTILLVLCLLVGISTAGNDLTLGSREEGDALVASRRLYRPPIPGKVMVAKSGFNVVGRITAITAVNAAGSEATISVLKGGIGNSSVVVAAIGTPGTGLDVQLDIYAIVNVVSTSEVDEVEPVSTETSIDEVELP